ncbi:NADP-dependent oxidoreductase [Solimonas marina]|uniref:NADP-dependent oxidoreductase n=1 Tax=Solimonas marina TaxID=2714601 RepID=A0A970B5L7_9GAMM|nr:NADP-dependent oxidoreductase [Solimonas marina]NKF21848.1 NADP-dependent oxidoreductase [Solimonas marina]
MGTMRRWYFNKRPTREIEADTLQLREESRPPLRDNEFLLRSVYLSMDATNRLWIGDWDLYMEPVALGAPMVGFTVGEVVESRHPDFAVGSLAAGILPWADYNICNGEGVQALPMIPGLKLADAFGILAVAGPTALVGLMEIGRPKPGDTVVVTAAAGAVGMLVGQIARIHGCRTIGIAGGAAKCRSLTEQFGYDAAIDYKSEDVIARLRELAPDGVDVHFENVGGEMLDAGLTVMKNFGSVVICGLISTYNSSGPVPGPYMFRNLIMRRLRVEGFVILDYAQRYPEFQAKLAQWMLEGRLHYRLHIERGLENAVDTLKLLYSGGNQGKVMLQIGAEPVT